MANFKEVNKAIRTAFPTLDIEVVRGSGYVYFTGRDGFAKVDSVYTNPTTTSTTDMIRMVVENIEDSIPQN